MTASAGSTSTLRHATTAGTLSPSSPMTTSTATENGNRSFKNTLTLSELIDKLVQQDAHESDRAHAALALQYLSLNMDKAMSIVQMPAAISGLVRIILEGTDEAKQHAAGALAHLAVNEEAEHVIAHSEGVLDALTALLLSGTEDAKEEAAAALENLSYSAESAVLAAQTIDLIPGLAMLLHTGKGKAIENAVGALQNLAVLAEYRVEIGSAPRLILSLANVMWSGSPKAQEGSAAIIGNLAVNSEIRTSVGCTDGVIDGLVMLLVDGTEKAKSDAAAALGNLAVNTELRLSILEMPRALHGLKCMLMEGSERHAGEAACCLQNLAVTTLDHKVRIAATQDLLQGLVNLMLRCQPASQYQEDACSALLNLVVGCTQNKKAVASVEGVMQALQRSLHTGNARTQEHGAAVLQNLTFNSMSNRLAVLAVPELLTSISNLVADARTGLRKAGEYAAACLASLARTRDGSLAIVRDHVAIEGLIQMATPENSMAARKASISALQALTQTPEAGALLFRSELPTRCFLPVLRSWHTLQHDETGRRIILQASLGIACLSGLDTRLLDLIPDIVIDVLVSALLATTYGEHPNNFKYKAIDVLAPLNILASKDENKVQLHNAGLVGVLLQILKSPEIIEREAPTIVEAAKLCWHLAFDHTCRQEILEQNIVDMIQGCSSDCQSWASGLAWHLTVAESAEVTEARGTNAAADLQHIMIIFDPSDSEVQGAVAETLMQGGHQIWSGNLSDGSLANMAGFVEAVKVAKLALVIMSPGCELNPCCRSQTRYIKENRLPYLCLNVGSAYESMYIEHGYLRRLGSSIKCTPAMFQGGDASAINGIVDDFLASGSKSWKAGMWLDQSPSAGEAKSIQDDEGSTERAARRAMGDPGLGLSEKALWSRSEGHPVNSSFSRTHEHTLGHPSRSTEHLEDAIQQQANIILRQQEEIQELRAQLARKDATGMAGSQSDAIMAAVEQALARFEARIGNRIGSEIQSLLLGRLDFPSRTGTETDSHHITHKSALGTCGTDKPLLPTADSISSAAGVWRMPADVNGAYL